MSSNQLFILELLDIISQKICKMQKQALSFVKCLFCVHGVCLLGLLCVTRGNRKTDLLFTWPSHIAKNDDNLFKCCDSSYNTNSMHLMHFVLLSNNKRIQNTSSSVATNFFPQNIKMLCVVCVYAKAQVYLNFCFSYFSRIVEKCSMQTSSVVDKVYIP